MSDILKSTFVSVEKMLDGKRWPQNVRALRLLTEELLRPTMLLHPDLTSIGFWILFPKRAKPAKCGQIW